MPRISGTLLGDNLAKVLVHTDPLKFRIRTNKTKSDPPMVAYFDPTVSSPKKNWCDLELVTVPNPPPPEFLSTIRVNGLPVPPAIHILVQALHELVAHYDSVKNEDGHLNWKPLKKVQKNIKKLSTQPFTASDSPCLLDESFMKIAFTLLKRLYAISPDLSPYIGAFIRRCEQKGYLPSLNYSTVAEIKKPTSMAHVDRQESLDNSATNFDAQKPVASQASLTEVVPTIHPTSPPQQTATYTLSRTEIVYHIAKQVVDILHRIRVECAIFGSLGCHLYGNERSPNVYPHFHRVSFFFSLTHSFSRTLISLPSHRQGSTSQSNGSKRLFSNWTRRTSAWSYQRTLKRPSEYSTSSSTTNLPLLTPSTRTNARSTSSSPIHSTYHHFLRTKLNGSMDSPSSPFPSSSYRNFRAGMITGRWPNTTNTRNSLRTLLTSRIYSSSNT